MNIVILGLFHHFYFLTLENKVIKRCSLSIYKVSVSGGSDASVLSFYSSSWWQKIQNLIFSEWAVLSTTLIPQIIDTNALIFCNNGMKPTHVIKKHSIAKVFAKTPISARPSCASWYVRNHREAVSPPASPPVPRSSGDSGCSTRRRAAALSLRERSGERGEREGAHHDTRHVVAAATASRGRGLR